MFDQRTGSQCVGLSLHVWVCRWYLPEAARLQQTGGCMDGLLAFEMEELDRMREAIISRGAANAGA